VADLALLPRGSLVFVDTNIFAYHFQGMSATCTAFFHRLAAGEVVGVSNTEVLSDLAHKLMLAEAQRRGDISKATAKFMKEKLVGDRGCIGRLPEFEVNLERVVQMGMRIVAVSVKLLLETRAERAKWGLMMNDSLHLGTMLRSVPPVADIATRDGDFGHVEGVTKWEPLDVVA